MLLRLLSDNFVKMLTAECQLERFLFENPPNEKNVDKATIELPGVQQELIKVVAANPKVCIKLLGHIAVRFGLLLHI